jgi:assimilatory nitrate reductase electron transfer subunit
MPGKIVVVGYGLAAHRFVSRLLEGGQDVEVTVYAGGPNAPYDREALPGVVAGRLGAGDVELPALSDPRLTVRHGVRATALDRTHRLVHGSDHGIERYDALVLATGANAVLPPIRGLRTADGTDLLRGVYPAHTLEDYAHLASAAASAERAVVIGGGLVGLSVAEALHTTRVRDPWRAPLSVELVDQSPAVPEITPADAFFALRVAGVVAYQDCRVRAVEEGPDGALAAVVLADGYRLTCDLAVLACGTAPNVALAWTSGLAVARGVVVDDALRSVSDPNVYALGSCAEHRRRLSGPSATAREQAEVLADRLSGRDPGRTFRGSAALDPRAADAGAVRVLAA